MKVNGREIPRKAVEYELNRLIQFYAQHGVPQERIRASLEDLKARAEEQVVGQVLLFAEAEKLAIAVTDDEVEASVADMAAEVGGMDKLKAILSRQGQNIVEFRNEIRRGKRVDKLVAKITSGIPDPTEAEAEKYFESHSAEFGKAEQVRAQHILVTPASPSAEDDLAALVKIRQIRERVQSGADFSEEAAANSDCPSGKSAGGSLGWFSRGQMVPEFDEAVFGMKVGEVSDIVKTQFGYHIIYKNDHEKESVPDFSEAREKVLDILRHEHRGEALAAHVNELRSAAKIEK